MARNIEIKARVADPEALLARVIALADRGPDELTQVNSFFNCPDGRLKLRVFSPTDGQLIFYRRPNSFEPKESQYLIAPTATPDSLHALLAAAFGETGRVCNRRAVFFVGPTRVHLDKVEGLGDFMELEVVLTDAQQPAEGVAIARYLMRRLHVSDDHLVDRAYVDLLNELTAAGRRVD